MKNGIIYSKDIFRRHTAIGRNVDSWTSDQLGLFQFMISLIAYTTGRTLN